MRIWCGRPDLNRHGKLLPRDFKSLASTISPRPRERTDIAHPLRRAAITLPKGRSCPDSSSWPDLFRPSTTLLAGIKDVDARDKRGHDDLLKSHPAAASTARAHEAAALSRYGLFFAVFCGAGRTSPQGSTVTFLSGILSIAAL